MSEVEVQVKDDCSSIIFTWNLAMNSWNISIYQSLLELLYINFGYKYLRSDKNN